MAMIMIFYRKLGALSNYIIMLQKQKWQRFCWSQLNPWDRCRFQFFEKVKKEKSKFQVNTTNDFASRTSIHGIGHIFDRAMGAYDRLLWLVVSPISFQSPHILMIYNTFFFQSPQSY